jgi:protein O-mannosyl-transferase
VYAPVRQHGFVNFDDPQYVSENPQVSAGLTRQGVWWAFTTAHAGNWHPLTWLSHMIDVELFGLDAGRHHLTSAFLHLVSTLLLFGVLQAVTGAVLRSAFVAALFAVHPLHVESVAWIAERKDVLSGLFFFLTVGAYAAHARGPRWSRYGLVVVLLALGLMAKPMLVTVPFVLLLLDHWPLGRLGSPAAWRRAVLEKLPLLGLALASGVMTLAAQRSAGAVKGLDVLPLDRRLGNAVLSYVAYIGQMLWPARLAAIYPYPATLPASSVLGAAACLVAVSVMAIRARHRHPCFFVGWLWYLVMLLPVIGLVQVGSQPRADRYTYLPLTGLFIAAAWGVPALLERWDRRHPALGAAAAAVVVACAGAAWAQVRHWRDSVTLWEHAVAITTGNHRAEGNLAHALAKQGRLEEAIVHYVEAVRLKPDYAEAHNNLGFVLAEKGRGDEAIAHYAEALRAQPDYVEAHNNLGVALTSQGRDREAIGHFQAALRLEPGLATSHNNLGVALARAGRPDEAVRHFSEALRLRPAYPDARKNLALAHNAIGAALADEEKLGEAIREMQEAVRLQPDQADLHYDLAVLLAGTGRRAEAVGHLETALRLDPAHAAARQARDRLQKSGDRSNPATTRAGTSG